ncbi:MAG: hypothetical protein ACOYJ2_02790 [Rickettsiales bacterium]
MAQGNTSTEEYSGTSKIGGAFAGWGIWGLISSLVLVPVFFLVGGNVPALIGISVVGLGAQIYGAYNGWKKAERGEQQFNQLRAERDEARVQLGQAAGMVQTMAVEQQALPAEVGEHRRRFTDGLRSHAEHGSHASAVEAQQIMAENATQAL